MYAVANIKKFLNDNPVLIGKHAEEILKRAERLAHEGVVSGGQIAEIMNDEVLADIFDVAVMSDHEHIRIGLDAIANRS